MKKWLFMFLVVLLMISCVACGDNPTEDFVEINWPTSELVSRIPIPESTFGDIMSESSDYFSVDIGNTTQAQFNAYVSACEECGFTVDYSKSSNSYSGYDVDGYYIWVNYDKDTGIMDIMTRCPEDDENSDETTTTAMKETTTSQKKDTNSEISSDFKKAMDSYEKFMNEYVDFMKKYMDDPTDMGLLSNYATYMSKYADFVKDFEKWEEEDLNTAEVAYYLDVQTRVNKKLLEVAE